MNRIPLPRSESQAPDVIQAADLAGLAAILEPGVQVCYLPRARNPDIDWYLDRAELADGWREVMRAGTRIRLDRLPDLPGRGALSEEINFLLGLYHDLLGCALIGLRVEVLASAMCPRFHVDHTGIRLLCTLRGDATEWLRNQHADRSKLGHAGCGGLDDQRSGLILHPRGVESARPFAIVLLKGESWPGNSGCGAIHRSPAVRAATAPRVLLALDAMWNDSNPT